MKSSLLGIQESKNIALSYIYLNLIKTQYKWRNRENAYFYSNSNCVNIGSCTRSLRSSLLLEGPEVQVLYVVDWGGFLHFRDQYTGDAILLWK